MMWLVIWVSVVLAVLYSQGADACPEKCRCRNVFGLNIYCEGKGLTEVPSNIPTDASYLFLRANKIATLPNGIFDALKNIRSMNLENNKIATLPEGIFDTLVKMTFLQLNDNQIGTLPNGIFDSLVNLETLYLYNNRIAMLPNGLFDALSTNLQIVYLNGNQITTLPNGIFDVLANLKTLSLGNNQITTLPDEIFDILVNLDLLSLENNLITVLPVGIFESLANLRVLAIDGNPLRCNCQLLTFLKFAESRNLQLQVRTKPSCESPPNLKGTLLNDKILQDMICDSDARSTQIDTGIFAKDTSTSRPDIDTTGSNSVTVITGVTVPNSITASTDTDNGFTGSGE
ncbi:carboxypeptidase N subunit 2-like isoform X2 [Ostrea edulis]|uniref:carboxypeptidase N subunit 2-like isoform X2 n=1 Tax=Ostrea edulis TaxID=37623 RepID=UPI0024AF0847|nr:carboxypeptidase N subunit 2-like isoform X2 [Ostrea edulis]